MKTKNWFVALIVSFMLSLSMSAAVKVDAFVIPVIGEDNIEDVDPGIYPHTSGTKAVYCGRVDYDVDYPAVVFDNTKIWAVGSWSGGATPGEVNSVTLYWTDDDAFYNNEGNSTIYVYGSATPFSGTETLGELAADPSCTLLGSNTFDDDYSPQVIPVAGSYSYIAIVGSLSYKCALSQLDIQWTVADETTYKITTTNTGGGTGKFSVKPGKTVSAGTEVTVTFTSGGGSELRSYSIDGASTVFTEDQYTSSAVKTTFVMPDHAVTINAAFETAPTREENIISINGSASDIAATIKSGKQSTFTISTKYSSGTSPAYGQSLKSITSANGRVAIDGNTYNPSTGTGVLTLRGLATGVDVITIKTYQTNGVLRAERNINVTVVARDVALVVEHHGKYFAVDNGIGGATTAAHELLKDGDQYFYKTGVNVSDIAWKAESEVENEYIRNSLGNYLRVNGSNMSFGSKDGKAEWTKNGNGQFVTGYLTGLCYSEENTAFVIKNEDVWRTISTYSACAYEVDLANVLSATEYTRSLTNGNYATMCLPFAVSASETFFSGAEVYIIVGKHVSAGNVTGIELEQVTDNLVAGKPYVILATASTLSAWHGNDFVGSPVNGDGLVGNLNSDPLTMPDGTYGIKGNKLRKINGGTGKVNQYRAYINLDGIPEVAATPTPAPGRRVIVTENSTESEEQQDVETSLEDLLNHATSINWNEPVYNALGQRVGKGTTGVLIQNGKKFFVQ